MEAYRERASVAAEAGVAAVLALGGHEEVAVGVGVGRLEALLPLLVFLALRLEHNLDVVVVVVLVLNQLRLVKVGVRCLEIALLDMLVGVAHLDLQINFIVNQLSTIYQLSHPCSPASYSHSRCPIDLVIHQFSACHLGESTIGFLWGIDNPYILIDIYAEYFNLDPSQKWFWGARAPLRVP